MKINDICTIRSGHGFRQKLVNDPDGQVKIIQPKNITEQGNIILNGKKPLRANVQGLKPLRTGDVLVVNKGRFAAAVFKMAGEDTWIVPSSVLVLTVVNDKVLPEYIALFLNSPNGQRLFYRHYEESTVPFISTENLGSMNIPVPDLEQQKTIVELYKSFQDFNRLSARKQELHKLILKHTLKQTEKSSE